MPRPARKAAPQRGRLSRQAILEAALEILTAEGVGALTMRRLAERLGVEAMSLYNHIADKRDLLDGVASLVLGRIAPPDPGLPWARRLEAIVLGLYEALSAHPQLVQLIASGQANPRDRQVLEGIDTILAALEDAGLSPQQQVSAFRGMLAMCFGLVLNHTLGLSVSPAEFGAQRVTWDPREWDAPGLPRLAGLAPYALSTTPHDDLRFMLDAYLAALGGPGRPVGR